MNYLFCGVVEVRGVQDQFGTACGRSAETLCYDCGTSLCSTHTQRCEVCAETFCPSCLSFHQTDHAKPASAENAPMRKRKSA
jgi:predicted sulfurtransferase